ncbi:MAG: protein kinase [Anaerolineae bacterium]|nr:protein kinase [Anaerolineae bacterium]
MADLTGTTLGQYTLAALIGQGGMAAVYRAHQTSMDRDVALKVMAPELAKNQEFVARFEREARVIARLQHPHILPVIDFGRDGEHIYLVMRYVQGSILSERLIKTTLTVQQVERFLGQIASALAYAHHKGVIHRDLKPTNVLLDEQENTYLTDFGIAKMLAGATSEVNLTATGHVMGTPAYMAPEQWRSEAVDARTDVYALGIMLYEMLIGSQPFRADTPYSMMYKHFDTPPPLPRVVNPDLPERIEDVILRALEKDPNARYPSAEQLAQEFSAAVRSTPHNLLVTPLPRATPDQMAKATEITQQRWATRSATYSLAQPTTQPHGASSVPISEEATQADGFMPAAHTVHAATPPSMAGQTPDSKRGRGLLVGGALIALLIVGAIIGFLVLGGAENEPDDPTGGATLTMTARIVQGITQTAHAEATRIALNPSAIRTKLATFTPMPSQTATHNATTAPPTVTATRTPNLAATTEALLAARLTQTAESWTDTPTPDLEATVQAQLIRAMTQTAAVWTKTPTPSPTKTATLPPLPTRTATRTWTAIPTLTLFPTHTPGSACSMPVRLAVDAGARTTLYPDELTTIRSAPGVTNNRLRTIPPGQTFWVREGPVCVGDINWWLIEGVDEDGSWTGWIGEGQNDTYWVETYDTGPIDCPDAPAPRLVPGAGGRITLSPPLPSRVRSSPERLSTNQIGSLQPGERFEVISGPVCDEKNNWRWWLVKNSEVEGWVAEGVAGEYWMEPATYP